MPRSTATAREARAQVNVLVASHVEAFVNLAKACADRPTGRQLQALFDRTAENLALFLRLREGLRRW